MANKMPGGEWTKIQPNYEKLISMLNLEHYGTVDYLYEKRVLTDHDKDMLDKTMFSRDKNKRLLEILKSKDDTAYGHFLDALKRNQDHLIEMLQPPRKLRSTTGKGLPARRTLNDFSVEELKDWLKPIVESENIPATILNKIEEEKINGKVFQSMSEQDLKEVFPELTAFGHRRTLMLAKTEAAETFADTKGVGTRQTKPSFQRTEYAREFAHAPSVLEKYSEGKILNVHEAHTENLTGTVRRFCPCLDETEIYKFIADEVVEFSAACLNDRQNGTIHFGISDHEYPDLGYEYGQILGVALDKKECENAIRQCLKRRFCGEPQSETALKCIHPAVFVDVVPTDISEVQNLYVCEVDVEPRSDIVKDFAFFVESQGEQEGGPVLFRYQDGVPVKQDAREVERFAAEKAQLTQERQQQEKSVPASTPKNLVEILKNCLCGGGDKLEGNFYPLLATSAIDTSHSDFEDTFNFLWHLDWRCIFDFDPLSDKKGLYQYLDSEKEKLYKIKRPSDFVTSSTVVPQSSQGNPEENFQDMAESELKTWIFCNGFTQGDEKGLNIAEWKRERSIGFREAVKFFRGAIPEGRAIIIIVLTSKDDIFIEASEELLLNFDHQWLMVAESQQLADAWMDGLMKRNVIFSSERCLSGVSFADVSKAIQQLQGAGDFDEDACVVRLPSGVDEEIPKKTVQELCDLDIVSANKCSVIDKCTETEVSVLSQETGDDFYKGNPATFWNFYFQGHVCTRDKYPLLLRYTRETLEGEIPDNASVGCVAVYHQPGAGGTTIATNVLWDLHKEYKCCLVKRITNETARQVVTLYEFADTATPVLLMLDNEDDEKIDQLQRNLEEECQNKGIYGLVCVFLLCSRRVTLPQEHHYKNILLKQELTPREKQFFLDKHEELKRNGTANLDNLLGLNIMKENFSESFIKRTVSSFLEEFKHSEETTLLEYIALLNCFDITFRAIPTSCFDPIMRFHGRGRRPWENTFTPEPLLKFTKNTKLSGKNKCLKITNKLLCRYILDASLGEERSIGNLMEEFLHSAVFQRNCCDFAYKELVYIVRDIMKKREWLGQGKRSTFSPFLQMLFDDKEYGLAVACMETVFQWTWDPIVAQQLARFHISCRKWDEADRWAEQATQRWPTNSYLWDTHGQICRFRLSEIRDECETSHDPPSITTILETVRIARKGVDTFRKVQELSSREKSVPPNTAGLFGQMDIAILLSKIFSHLMPVDELQKFFSGTYIPQELNRKVLHGDIHWLRSVLEAANSCLQSAEEIAEMYSAEGYGQTSAKIFLSGHNLKRYKHQIANVFGKEDLVTAEPRTLSPDRRRTLIRNLGGYSLYSILSLCREPKGKDAVEKILQLSSLNIKQHDCQHSTFDLSMALASALTLCSRHDYSGHVAVQFSELLRWSLEFYKQKTKQESQYLDLDPYLFLLIFHWPNLEGQPLAEQCQPADLHKAVTLASETFKKKFSGDPSSRKKNVPLYFLTKKPGANKVVSKDQLQVWSTKEGRQGRLQITRMLQSQKAVELLQRFTGILTRNGNEVELRTRDHCNRLSIPLFVREGRPSVWNKKVFVVLAFGLGGPLACDVRQERPSPNQAYQAQKTQGADPVYSPRAPQVTEYDEEIEQISERIREIQKLQQKPLWTRKEEMAHQELPLLVERLKQLQEARRNAMFLNT
ncbi:hypothetical protein BaRGS_00026525 [Batillaria attramentaria]|uniref:Uncharacterized protein n=1 Tax=Batillaria attramentaria TaxID=370345 RepID=A0ABD0K641_9CAEN